MTGASWACSALLYLQLMGMGALPKEISLDRVRPYAIGQRQVRILISGRGVKSCDLETYVAGVVAAEMPKSFPFEALKAQAVAARTYALYHLGDHADQNADLCASVHCQAYVNPQNNHSAAREAARQTAGQVLAYNGLLVDALYHSCCGGETAPAWAVRQGKLLPYLQGSPDYADIANRELTVYCNQGHQTHWQRRVSRVEAQRLINANLGILLAQPGLKPGRLISLQLRPGKDGPRAEWLEIKAANGFFRVRGDAIRWLFGKGRPGAGGLPNVPSKMRIVRSKRGAQTTFIFEGQGRGHGIGLCQWGARGRALEGQSYNEILSAYYPGVEIVNLSAVGQELRRFSGGLPAIITIE